MKRLEELARESSALKPHLIPPMKALSNLVPELVNFGISVCSVSRLMPASLLMATFISF
jgi:dynactin 1